MAERFSELTQKHCDFIRQQAMYFVGTADINGYVNISPKGQDTLRILDSRQLAWLNLTGSGNESAAHVLSMPRMTLMFCSFDRQPLILRVYGNARVIHPRDSDWYEMSKLFPALLGARQIFVLDIKLVQTSCGYAVPYFEFKGQRKTLHNWADKKGQDGIRDYWLEKNALSLNDKDTGIT